MLFNIVFRFNFLSKSKLIFKYGWSEFSQTTNQFLIYLGNTYTLKLDKIEFDDNLIFNTIKHLNIDNYFSYKRNYIIYLNNNYFVLNSYLFASNKDFSILESMSVKNYLIKEIIE